MARPQHSSAGVIAKRFWALLGTVLLVAIASAALSVRFVAHPFFERYQTNAINVQAEKSAAHFNAHLEHNRMLLSVIAREPALINITLGYEENPEYLAGHLGSLDLPGELSWITLYDAFGESISQFDVRPSERRLFSRPELSELIETTLNTPFPERRPALLEKRGLGAFLVFATPIMHHGYAEGVLLSGYNLDVTKAFPNNGITKRTFIAHAGAEGTDTASMSAQTVYHELDSFQLSLALVPDLETVHEAGSAVLMNSVTAVSIVLIGAFTIFALIGRKVIIAPHEELAKKQSELRDLAAIAERANDAILVTNLDSKITWANPAFEKLSGQRLEDIVGLKPGAFLQGPETDPETMQEIREAVQQRRAVQVEILNYRRRDETYWVSLSISPLKDVSGNTYGFMAITNDITAARTQREEIYQAKKEIEHQALHDPLTGLPNRRALDIAFRERLNATSQDCTIVRIDLDHFKYVNDTMGHDAGDFVLQKVAHILKEETKSSDLPARVGGDEFVLLLAPGSNTYDAECVARRMLKRIREPKLFENKSIRVGASFGVASTESGLLELEELIIGADAALYKAKEDGRNCISTYTSEVHRKVQNRRTLAREIRRAITRDEFYPHFQPQFDASTHEITGVETLARWHSPDFGIVMPGDFLPVAEQLSILDEIDQIIFRKAVKQISSLAPMGIHIPKVSVNVTVEHIQSDHVFAQVQEHLGKGLEIGFEILESVLVEEQSELFKFGIDRLREAGIQIEVDDFGSGHASIVGLMHLRPDTMKIDQRLVRPITQDAIAFGLLENIVAMAKLMNMQIIAEGVETMEHASLLRESGCHILQGFAFCRPLPIDELRKFVLHHQTRLSTRARSG